LLRPVDDELLIDAVKRAKGGSVILSNGITLEVSRRKKDIFLGKMKEFYKF
jgi:two-component system LytT family response regulator